MLGKGYLNLDGIMYPNILVVLETIFDPGVRVVWLRLGKGSGKTFVCGAAMSYSLHRLLCMNDPQLWYDLSPRSKIVVANMSTGREQAHLAVWTELQGMVEDSPWLSGRLVEEPLASKLKFQGRIWAICGHSKKATQEGAHLNTGVLDEACRFDDKPGRRKAEKLVEMMISSAETRFPGDYKVLVVSSQENDDDYLGRKLKEFREHGAPLALELDLSGYEK